MSPILPRTSGIYRITCIPTNKIYIGSAVNLHKRWINHRSSLNTRKHRNQYLQRAWNKYGETAFQVDVIELCEKHALLEREQYYLDNLNPYDERGYNIAVSAIGSALGRIPSAETRYKMGGNRGRIFSAEVRAKVSVAGKGRKPSMATRKLLSEQKGFKFIATTPEGIEIEGVGLGFFCKGNGLDTSCMARVARGESKSHKGWKCKYV